MLPHPRFTSLKSRPHAAVFVPKQCYFAFLLSHRDCSISSVCCVLDTKEMQMEMCNEEHQIGNIIIISMCYYNPLIVLPVNTLSLGHTGK